MFFAFQMDIDDKFGKGFIQSAIEIAIQKFKDEGIDVSLDFGFRGTPGTPLLIEEMLKKSSESDMVIVDLTFTSSKIWSDSKKISILGKEIRILKKTQDKKSPNPNVLLETGYAWAKKGTYRTLAVMNAAFGSPDLLPVDLKGFRWGITYSLNDDNYSDRKSIRKDLSNDLYDAIKAAISSEAQYQQEKLNPIKLRRNWRPRDFNTVFRPTDDAKDKIKKLRIDLENKEVAQRIVGPKNAGKTRLAFELYRKIDADIDFHENHEKVLYYDLDGGDIRSIESKLIDLKELNQRKILILDNCSLKIHNKVFDEYFYDTNVSLLSIDNDIDGEGATCFLDNDFANDVIEKICYEIGNPKNTKFIIEYSKGNLRKAIPIIGKIPEGDDGLSEDYQTLWQQILGTKLFSVKTLKVLEELSLFTHVGFTDRFEKQSEILLINTEIETRDELNEIIQNLAETGIVKITGDFIILEAFIEELAASRLARLTTEDLNNYLKNITNLRLSKQFSNRLIELNKLKGTKSLIESLTTDNGLFRKDTFVNSKQGARILMSLAEIEPVVVLDILNHTLSDKSIAALKEVKDGRRYLVWTLERLAYRPETFEGAAKILFKLAVAENEEIGDNATFQFCQLFQIFLPGTSVSLEVRVSLLVSLIIEASPDEKAVITYALDRALMTRGFTRMGGADVQAGVKLEDYRPNNKEVENYWNHIISLAERLEVYKILENRFREHLYNGAADAMVEAIERILRKTRTISKTLREHIEHLILEPHEINKTLIERIECLYEELTQDESIREKFINIVAQAPYLNRKEEGKYVNVSEEKAHALAKELIQSTNLEWLRELDVLLSNEQRITFLFGESLGKLKPNFPELIDEVIAKMKLIPFEQQNNSLIAGYCCGIQDDGIKREIIAKYLQESNVSYHAIQLTRYLDIKYSDIELLYPLIESNPNYVIGFQYVKLGALVEDDFERYLNWVLNIEPNGWWVSVASCYDYFKLKDTIEEQHRIILKKVLMRQGVFSKEENNVSMTMMHYEELFNYYAKGTLEEEFCTFLSIEIIEASKQISLYHEFHIVHILNKLLSEYWEYTWGVIGIEITKDDYYGWYTLKSVLSKVNTFEDSRLLEWMEKYPGKAPQKAVAFIPLTSSKENDTVWSDLMLEMFNRFFNNQEFLNTLQSELHSYSWSGSLVPLFEGRINLLKQIEQHTEKEVRAFALRNIKYFEDRIKKEKRSDENYGLDY